MEFSIIWVKIQLLVRMKATLTRRALDRRPASFPDSDSVSSVEKMLNWETVLYEKQHKIGLTNPTFA